MRPWLAAVLVMCATCGAPERSRPGPVSSSPAPVTAFPSGMFAITAARVISDHCDNRLRFSTKTLDIDLASSSVQSFPESRVYEAVLDQNTLVARGPFNRNSLCRTYRQLEIWRLERESDDEISGYRTTYWRDPVHNGRADCLQACKVVFAVEAVRADPDEGGDE